MFGGGGLGFRVLRFRDWGGRPLSLRFRVQGLGFRIQDLGFRVWGLRAFLVWGLGFGVKGLRFRVQDSGFRVQGQECATINTM